MGLKNLLRQSSNETYRENKELLEEHNLLNTFGSPNKLFLKFLSSKNLKLNEDIISNELIEEFENSIDSTNVKLAKIQKEKEIIFEQKRVWINIPSEEKLIGSDMLLKHDGIFICELKKHIMYSKIKNIEVSEGSWSKNKIIIESDDGEFVFEINESKTIPLIEILEDNIEHKNYNEIDDLLRLYEQFENGEITEEQLESRKNAIYSDNYYCTNCGFELESDSEFCSNCGNQVK